MICENCGKLHDGSYGSGRFCSKFCAHSYVAKQNLNSKNKKRSIAMTCRKLTDIQKLERSLKINPPSLETRLKISRSMKSYMKEHPEAARGENLKDLGDFNKSHSIDHTNDVPPEGYVSFGKYLIQKCPGHPKAYISGDYVYAHILSAEKQLGRYLSADETVHHIDFDGWNNDPSNLMVFKTRADHSRFHYMLVFPDDYKLVLESGVYKVIRLR